MRLAGKLVLVAAGVLFGLPLLGATMVIVGGNTAPGRHAIEHLIAKVTDGAVRIDGLAGQFPDALRARHVVLSDHAGVWLTIDQARLDWSPLRLIVGDLHIATLEASHVSLARLPETAGSGSAPLPISITIDDVQVGRLDLAKPIAGAAASVRVKGDLHWISPKQGSFTLDVERLDSAGSYRLSGTLTPRAMSGRVNVSEPAHGLLSGITNLPDLGPISISAALEGPRRAERMTLRVSAGDLSANGNGTIDLPGRSLDIDLTAAASAMAPRRGLHWKSVRLNLQLSGPLARPAARGQLDIKALQASDIAVGQLQAKLEGSNGKLDLTAALAGLGIPGPRPDLFAAAPFILHATALLDAPGRPVTFTVSQPLIAASGQVSTSRALAGAVAVTFPSLAPYAAIAGVPLQGHAMVAAKFRRQAGRTHVNANGTIGIAGGLPSAAAIIGGHATFSLTGSLQGRDVSLENLEFNGRTLHAAAEGSAANGNVDLGWKARLSNLSDLVSAMAGTMAAHGQVHGLLHDLALTTQATAEVAAAGLPPETLTASLEAHGLPNAPAGRLDVHGRLAGAPLELAARVSRQSNGALSLFVDRLKWKSASGSGALQLPAQTSVPLGHMEFRLAHIADIAPLIGLKATGSIRARFETSEVQGKPEARFQAELRDLRLAGDSIDRLTVHARVADPVTHPVLTAAVRVNGIHRGALTGDASVTAKGPLGSLRLEASSALRTTHGRATLSASAIAVLPERRLRLTTLAAEYRGETAHLLRPADIRFVNGLSVGNVRIVAGGAVIDLAGRLTPTLALTFSGHNLTPALARPFSPDWRGSGAIALNGQLHGSFGQPQGTLHITGRKLAIAKGNLGGLPPADIDATAVLMGTTAHIVAQLTAGGLHLRLAGTAPLRQSASIDLRLSGATDLGLFNPLLTPNGRAIGGQAKVNLAINGTMARPQLTGSMGIRHGMVEDFVQGIHITDIRGLVRGDGTALRIVQFDGHAGPGTVSCVGTIGIFQPDLPIALTIEAHNALLPASNLLTATTSATLTVRTAPNGMLSLSGPIHVSKADIQIPDRFPESVAVLNVRRLGEKPPAPSPPKHVVAFALAIEAPEQVFVRGHGLEAEMAGTVKIDGTSVAPMVSGGFHLRHGTFNFAGQTLNFTTGKVSFGGTGLTTKIDPTIDFVAENTANGVTATLTITGYADAPKIALSSSPELPQDEILAHLLFGQSVKQLSPFQVAEIAQGIASLSGVGGPNPLAAVRKNLGLDRLTVSSAPNAGTSVEAGKYVANGVYVGSKQGISGGTQAQVQIDLTKRLKLESTLATTSMPATGATPSNDPGSSVGLSYQFEY